jgi:hypothetical protein
MNTARAGRRELNGLSLTILKVDSVPLEEIIRGLENEGLVFNWMSNDHSIISLVSNDGQAFPKHLKNRILADLERKGYLGEFEEWVEVGIELCGKARSREYIREVIAEIEHKNARPQQY